MYKELACEEGDKVTQRNREATYDCHLDYIPDPELVKANLLIDGSYLDRFNATITAYPISENTFLPYALKYYLLLGRYNVRTGDISVADKLFNRVIDEGEDEDYFFAAEAAMRLGLLYEKSNTLLAKKYFEMAVNLYDSDYYEYIDDESKKALKRLEK